MSDSNLRQTAKLSSLEAARNMYFIVAALAVREALLFARSTPTESGLSAFVGWVITITFLITLFRYSHGIAVVYELEKRTTQNSTAPSSKRVELIFALFILEAVAFFLMANSLGQPRSLVKFIVMLLAADVGYISVSKTIKDASIYRLLDPIFWYRRWKWTVKGTAARTHLQWAISDIVLGLIIAATVIERPQITKKITIGNSNADWILTLAGCLVLAAIVDYAMNGRFYFGGLKADRTRKLVFVCSPLSGKMRENIRTAQWYCRQLYLTNKVVPFASHGFYPYFLDDNNALHRRLGRRCALEFLDQCDAIYVYTPDASTNELGMSQGMKEELRRAREGGLEIKFLKAEVPPATFQPAWATLSIGTSGKTFPEDVNLDTKWKRVFICSPLREGKTEPSELAAAIKKNIRVAQWLCHELIRKSPENGEMHAPIAPHAFYPFFMDFKESIGLQWLPTALDVLKTCDAVHVFTIDGLESSDSISEGMRLCIDDARELGLEIQFCRLIGPPIDWVPQPWTTAITA